MTWHISKFSSFRRREDGSATIEFAILFPALISLFLMGFESGLYMVRNVMLERAVDISVRDIRLGNGKVPSYADLRAQICERSVVFPDCEDKVQIHMERVDIEPGGIDKMRVPWRCISQNSSENRLDDTAYDVGVENAMMVLRVCMVQSPFFPTTSLGAGLKREEDGLLAMVASSAFVNEPGTRAFASSGTNTGGLNGSSEDAETLGESGE